MRDKLKESKDKLRQSAFDRLSSLSFYVKTHLEPSTMAYKDAMAQIVRYKESVESKILAQLALKFDFIGQLYSFEQNIKALVSEHKSKSEYAVEFLSEDSTKNICYVWADSFFGARIKFQSFKTLCSILTMKKMSNASYANTI